MSQFEYRYSRKNDGEPSPYSSEQLALSEAFFAYHETGHYEWNIITIARLECDQREEHYPDLCWHYLITIGINPSRPGYMEDDYDEIVSRDNGMTD